MNFGEAIASCMGKYATFEGTASRSEFWWFYLFTVLLAWAAEVTGTITMGVDGGLYFSTIVNLVLLVPSLAVSSRRLHDIGKSGWWILLFLTIIGVIVLIVWWATDTKPEREKYVTIE